MRLSLKWGAARADSSSVGTVPRRLRVPCFIGLVCVTASLVVGASLASPLPSITWAWWGGHRQVGGWLGRWRGVIHRSFRAAVIPRLSLPSRDHQLRRVALLPLQPEPARY